MMHLKHLAYFAADVNDTRSNAFWNVSSPTYNGTDVEGDQSLDINQFFFQQVVSNNIAIAAVTLYCWEFLSTLYDEIRLYRSHKLLSRPVILFALVRYGTLPSLVLPAYSVWHDFSSDPSGCIRHQQLAIAVVQLIVSVVFAWRTIAIWNHDKKMIAFLIAIVCLHFGASFGLLYYSDEILLPNGSCQPVTPKDGFNPLPPFYIIAFAFDALTIALSSYKLWKISTLGRSHDSSLSSKGLPHIKQNLKELQRDLTSSPLVQRLFQAGLFYFTLATTFNAVAFALEVSKNIHSKAPITLYAPLMAILCQRIILQDVQAIWGNLDKKSGGSNEQALVNRVINDRRHSWEGSDPSSGTTRDAEPSSLNEKTNNEHVTVDMEGTQTNRTDGDMDFNDMLHEAKPYQQSKSHKWKLFHRSDNSTYNTDASIRSPSLAGSAPPPIVESAIITDEADKAEALRLAGFGPSSPSPRI